MNCSVTVQHAGPDAIAFRQPAWLSHHNVESRGVPVAFYFNKICTGSTGRLRMFKTIYPFMILQQMPAKTGLS